MVEPRDWRAGLEAASVFAAILLYMWWMRARIPLAWLAILGAVVLSQWMRREGAADLGFRLYGLKAAFLEVLPSLLLVILALLAAGLLLNTLRSNDPERSGLNLLAYLPWGLLQQYLLNAYFANRLRRALGGDRAAAWGVAALFATAHVPNLFLMGVGLAGGYACARLYQKHRNLYLLGILHGAIGWTLHFTLPDRLTHFFIVGPGYFGR